MGHSHHLQRTGDRSAGAPRDRFHGGADGLHRPKGETDRWSGPCRDDWSTEAPRGKVTDRADWYDYVARVDFPTIAVIQDIDGRTGYGAYWGEVQSTIHKALGSIGCVTNGSFRDLDMWAPGYQMIGGRIGPSHAHVHMVDFGKPVNIFGMQVGHDDVVHADFHGAVVVPADAVRKLPAAIDLVSRREKVISGRLQGGRL